MIFTALLGLIVLLPMVGVALGSLRGMADGQAWRDLWLDTQTWPAWGMSVWTGIAATVLSWWLSAWMLAQVWTRAQPQPHQATRSGWAIAAMLATPHAALAIGLLAWLSPSGWLIRLISPWLTGWDFPPAWPTSQDPWGLGLILTLVSKEIPFLWWSAATQWARDDVSRRWRDEYAVALTLGYTPKQAFWRVIWPQLAPRLSWPLWAVLAYSLTVVDVALVIGPTSPPTLAVLAWQWLRDADAALQPQGAAASGVLALSVVLGAGVWGLARWGMKSWHFGLQGFNIKNDSNPLKISVSSSYFNSFSFDAIALLWLVYAAVWWGLALGSVMGSWPFPALWPESWSVRAWHSVWHSAATLGSTVGLAMAASGLSLLWCVAWLECAPRAWERRLRPIVMLPLVWPHLLWAVGLYQAALYFEAEGFGMAVLLAHISVVLPYVLLSLSPAYLGFDPRAAHLSASLGHPRGVFLWRVKWPLLRRALASAWAVGVAVSIGQYVATLYVGAGAWATVTTEAVHMAAGGQRALASAYAGLQALLPLLAFGVAAWVGRPRRFQKQSP